MVHGGDDSEGGWRGRGGHHSVPTRMPVLKKAKETLEVLLMTIWLLITALINSIQSIMFLSIMLGLRIQL